MDEKDQGFLNWTERMFAQHKAMRRGVMVWAMALVTAVSYQVFWVRDIEGAALAAAYGTAAALVGTAIGLYTWSRNGK